MGIKNTKIKNTYDNNMTYINKKVYGLDCAVNPFDNLKYVKVINFGKYTDNSDMIKFYVIVNIPETEHAAFLSVVYGSGYFIRDQQNNNY